MDKRKGFILIALYLLLLTSIEFGVPYALRVHHEFPTGKDAHWHLENLKVVYNIITGEGDASIKDMAVFEFFYPPIVYLLSAPFCLIHGKVDYAAAYIPYFAIWFMLNLGLYLLARELGGLWAGVLAPLAFLGYRQIVWILGVYNLTIPLCAWLPFLLMFTFRTKGFLRTGRTVAFFALLAFSFLTYIWVVQFMFFPVLTMWLLYGRPYKKSLANILLGAAVGFAIVSPYVLGTEVKFWLLHHFPGLMMMGYSKVALWSGFFTEGNLFYVINFFKEPLGWLFLVGVVFVPFKDKRAWVLLSGFLGGFLLLHVFKTMYLERLVPLYVFTSVLLAWGIARAAVWLRGAMLIVLFTAVCLSFVEMDYNMRDLTDLGHDRFHLLSFLEEDCRKHPDTNYIWRQVGDDALTTHLWTSSLSLDCLQGRMNPRQDDDKVAADGGHRLLMVAWSEWGRFCERFGLQSPDLVYYGGLWSLLCDNADGMRTLYSGSAFAVLELPMDARLPPSPAGTVP